MTGGFRAGFALVALAVLFAAPLVTMQDAAHAQQLQAVTERGNVFVLERTAGDGDGDGGVSGLAGFGAASRLIYKEYDGIVIHGTGRTGTVDSMTPYHRVPEHTDFVAAIGSAGGTARLAIPEFYMRYDLAQGRLAESDPPGTDPDSILGYSEQRTLRGDITVSSVSSQGIEVAGAGRLVLKLNGMDGALGFRGTLAPGAEVRLVESPYDLMALPHDRAAGGFLTSRVMHDPGIDGLSVLAGPAGISEVRAAFSYDQQVVRTYWHDWRGVWNATTVNRVSVSPDLVMGPGPSGYRIIAGDRTDPVPAVPSPPIPNHGIVDVSNTVLNFEHAIYDTLPARQLHQWSTSPFDGVLEVGQGTKYLVIDSPGGRSVIGAGAAPEDYDNPLFSIHGLPADTPYAVTTQEGETIVTGMTGPAGVARHVLGGSAAGGSTPQAGETFTGWFCDPPHFSHDTYECVPIGPGTYAEPRAAAKGHCPDPSLHVLLCHRETFTLAGSGQQDGGAGAFAGEGGHLLLYPQSLTWTGTGSEARMAFDHLNSETIRLGNDSAIAAGTAYNAHAYAKIPVTGNDLEISGTRLDGAVMPYLDGSYSDGDALHVPIIPGHRTIHMEANGLPVSIAVGDLIGDSNLRIADTSSSTVRVAKPSGFTTQIGATAGAVTFVVAGTDGKIKAHLSARVSGESAITNTRELEYVPPPPPPPRPRDPLTTWVEVYVNGVPRQIDGLDRTRIFFSDAPLEDHDSGVTGTSSWHTARFSYPEVDVSDTISVPVDAGDFVEVYFYTKIEAHGSVPPLPRNFAEVSRSSVASATAVLEYATMGTSM